MELHRDDLRAEFRQDRRLVTAAGSNLQHSLRPSQLQKLGYASDDIRLRDSLTAADREGTVRVSRVRFQPGNESMTRNLKHCLENLGVVDTPCSKLNINHLFSFIYSICEAGVYELC